MTRASDVYTAHEHDPTGGDGFIAGTWRKVEDALCAGRITDDEYRLLALDEDCLTPELRTRIEFPEVLADALAEGWDEAHEEFCPLDCFRCGHRNPHRAS